MANPEFARFVSPRKFGTFFDPPVSERTVYRWIRRPNGLPITTLPSGAIRVDTVGALKQMENGIRQVAPTRQGRRANLRK